VAIVVGMFQETGLVPKPGGCHYSTRRAGAGLILISCHPGDWSGTPSVAGLPAGL
jgi:hypothetical protein